MRPVIALIALLLSAACAHQRPLADANCLYPAYPLKTPVGEASAATNAAGLSGAGAKAAGSSPFYDMMERALKERRNYLADEMGAADQVLALSGGSQNGAFGAGFFLGLSERGEAPRYDIVTGVSTGALQSTFLFLAGEPRVSDRIYPSDLGFSQDGPDEGPPGALKKIEKNSGWVSDLAIGFSIRNESSLLKRKDNFFFGKFGAALIDGSAATLAPAQQRLETFLTDEALGQIRKAAAANRLLLVGVTNLDDGEAYAIDLTGLAASIKSDDTLRRCYARAVIASSTVPLGAPPVTLRLLSMNTPEAGGTEIEGLFIDGGARFALFLDQVLKLAKEKEDRTPLDVTAIVNGSLFPREWTDADGQRVNKWSILNVGLRSIDILQNQVTQFSLDAVEAPGKRPGVTRIAYIGAPAADGKAPEDFEVDGRTCKAWRKIDEEELKPFEFFPRTMRCLLEYGHSRGAADSWDKEIERQ